MSVRPGRPRQADEADADARSGEEAEKQKIREEVTDAPPPAAPPKVGETPAAPEKKPSP